MANEQMRDAWGSRTSLAWIEHQRTYDAAFAPLHDRLVTALAVTAGEQVLDVGCGTGALSASVVAAGGRAVGVDIAAPMIDAASDLVPDARFAVADAQTDDLAALADGGPFDAVTSRFGVMFFDDPIAAFANLRSATRSGGRLTFMCWRGTDENPLFSSGFAVLEAASDSPPAPPRPGVPGPVAFAEPDHVRGVLGDAGWAAVTLDPYDAELRFGIDGSDGVEERLAQIVNGQAGQALEAELRASRGDDGWAALLEEVRVELGGFVLDGRFTVPGAVWIVTARNT